MEYENRTVSDAIVKYALKWLCDSGQNDVLWIGVSATQGCGKTTQCHKAIRKLDEYLGPGRATTVSIDDFYLPHEQQLNLAARGNRLLRARGLPGTHDLIFLIETIDRTRSLCSEACEKRQRASDSDFMMLLPQYDKSKNSGQGDRLPECKWLPADCSKLRVVLFEGWMLGFEPCNPYQLSERFNKSTYRSMFNIDEASEVNTLLENYASLRDRLSALIWIQSPIEYSLRWREQQEEELIKKAGHGLSSQQLLEFMQPYLLCYDIYLPDMRSNLNRYMQSKVLHIDDKRHLID